jgi:predicted Zn-dependent peptidase
MFYNAESYINLGRINTLSDIKRQVAEITSSQITALAEKLFDFRNICISCIGNVDGQEDGKIREVLAKFNK